MDAENSVNPSVVSGELSSAIRNYKVCLMYKIMPYHYIILSVVAMACTVPFILFFQQGAVLYMFFFFPVFFKIKSLI